MSDFTGLLKSEKEAVRGLIEADSATRLKVAANLVKSDPESGWAIVAATRIPGLLEAVKAHLQAGGEGRENMDRAYPNSKAFIPVNAKFGRA